MNWFRPAAAHPGRILVVTSGFPRRSETFALGDLQGLLQRGSLAAALATKPGDGLPVHPGTPRLAPLVQVLPADSPEGQARWAVDQMNGLRATISGVHGYFAHTPAEVAMRIARRLRVPYSFGVHARDTRKVTRHQIEERADGAACIVACNLDAAAALPPGAPIRIVPHGVDLVRFRPTAPASGPLSLLAVGRLVPKKGFDVLLRAVAGLRRPFTLRILGDGPERESLQDLIHRLELGDRVRLERGATHDVLPSIYANADIVVVPSVIDASGDRDGLPNVVLEAMASARPVVASRVGATAAGVIEGETGLLVPPGDPDALAQALDDMAGDHERRITFGRAARARAERYFDVRRCTELLAEALEAAYA